MDKFRRFTFVFLGAAAFLIAGCGSAQINYRPIAEYEQAGKHWCAVKNKIFKPDEASSAADYGLKTYFFCCSECEDIFKANPLAYTRVVLNDERHQRGNYREKDNSGVGGGSCH